MSLIIRSSAIHAAGCYTTAPILKGTRIVEYTGPRIPKNVADELYQNSPTTYLFGLGDGTSVIDGHGTAMFINHSCAPNCETDELKGRVWISALRDIAAGEELTYDYFLYDGDEDDPAICHCGAPNCRKTMYSPEEAARRERKAARQLRQVAEKAGKKATTKKHAKKQAEPHAEIHAGEQAEKHAAKKHPGKHAAKNLATELSPA